MSGAGGKLKAAKLKPEVAIVDGKCHPPFRESFVVERLIRTI